MVRTEGATEQALMRVWVGAAVIGKGGESRHLDMIANPEVLDVIRKRAKVTIISEDK
ncbi:hypothetical protein QJS04_geneDACA004430 [Acorus gramineus]|uniref:Uncharacterized protein n=1 Tax=Acorus gramineus TaxID=55184 RepID=A0AAV9B3I2_ACOGR|nr:hypothetical protein QJS04_geneDACA004430 [Acorus gramineus]